MTRTTTVLAVLALAALVAAAGCTNDPERPAAAPDDSTGPGRTPDADPECSPPNEPPVSDAALQGLYHDGGERQYLLAVPEGYDGTEAVPLLFSFHGHGGDAVGHEANTSLAAAGAARGFVVVTPTGLGDPARWNLDRRPDGPDDHGFVRALLAHLDRTLCLDPDRTYLAGHSNGSGFAGLLACEEPQRFAGVAMVSGTAPPTCPDGVAPATLVIAGTDDATVPYLGGPVGDVPEVVAGYAERYGCAPPVEAEPQPGIEQVRYEPCRDGGAVVLDTVVGGVHVWPGSRNAIEQADGSEAGRAFSATDEVLDFFEQHPAGAG
jgi:polyhydroxybutyrate depolymerase